MFKYSDLLNKTLSLILAFAVGWPSIGYSRIPDLQIRDDMHSPGRGKIRSHRFLNRITTSQEGIQLLTDLRISAKNIFELERRLEATLAIDWGLGDLSVFGGIEAYRIFFNTFGALRYWSITDPKRIYSNYDSLVVSLIANAHPRAPQYAQYLSEDDFIYESCKNLGNQYYDTTLELTTACQNYARITWRILKRVGSPIDGECGYAAAYYQYVVSSYLSGNINLLPDEIERLLGINVKNDNSLLASRSSFGGSGFDWNTANDYSSYNSFPGEFNYHESKPNHYVDHDTYYSSPHLDDPWRPSFGGNPGYNIDPNDSFGSSFNNVHHGNKKTELFALLTDPGRIEFSQENICQQILERENQFFFDTVDYKYIDHGCGVVLPINMEPLPSMVEDACRNYDDSTNLGYPVNDPHTPLPPSIIDEPIINRDFFVQTLNENIQTSPLKFLLKEENIERMLSSLLLNFDPNMSLAILPYAQETNQIPDFKFSIEIISKSEEKVEPPEKRIEEINEKIDRIINSLRNSIGNNGGSSSSGGSSGGSTSGSTSSGGGLLGGGTYGGGSSGGSSGGSGGSSGIGIGSGFGFGGSWGNDGNLGGNIGGGSLEDQYSSKKPPYLSAQDINSTTSFLNSYAVRHSPEDLTFIGSIIPTLSSMTLKDALSIGAQRGLKTITIILWPIVILSGDTPLARPDGSGGIIVGSSTLRPPPQTTADASVWMEYLTGTGRYNGQRGIVSADDRDLAEALINEGFRNPSQIAAIIDTAKRLGMGSANNVRAYANVNNGATLTNTSSAGLRNYQKSGGMDQANKDFDAFTFDSTNTFSNGGRMGRTGNTEVKLYPISSSTQSPTIEILVNGRSKEKYRY